MNENTQAVLRELRRINPRSPMLELFEHDRTPQERSRPTHASTVGPAHDASVSASAGRDEPLEFCERTHERYRDDGTVERWTERVPMVPCRAAVLDRCRHDGGTAALFRIALLEHARRVARRLRAERCDCQLCTHPNEAHS